MFRSTRVALGFLFVTLFCAPAAFAQGGTGQLSGNVVDANGAVIAGANVKLTSLVTAQERETTTNDSTYSSLRIATSARCLKAWLRTCAGVTRLSLKK